MMNGKNIIIKKQNRLNQIRILMSDGKQHTCVEIRNYIKSCNIDCEINSFQLIDNDIYELMYLSELKRISKATYIATSTLKEKYIKLPDQNIKQKLIIATELYNEKARKILKQSPNDTNLAYSLINNFCTDIINDCEQL